jgi:energy-coupling factor transporter transmembrane protein EcfT
MSLRDAVLPRFNQEGDFQLGPIGNLIIFFWSLAMVMLVPVARLVWTAVICLVVTAVVYPHSFRRILRLRFLVMLALLSLPPLFLMAENGGQTALQIGLRFVVVLTAVDGFTHAVDISQIAGLLERLGLRGLGFSLGVALNLLPSLQQSSLHAWQSLRMRGGLHNKKWRGLRLLGITIVTSTLKRAEEIALAAEARAFSPDCCRPIPLKASNLDRFLLPVCMFCMLIVVLWP